MARTSRIAAARISGAGWIRIRSNSAYFEDTIARVSNSVLYITNKWVSDRCSRVAPTGIFPCGKAVQKMIRIIDPDHPAMRKKT